MSALPQHQLRGLSKLLFGNKLRLEIAAAVAESPGDVYARLLAEWIGVNDNLVASELRKLEQAGLLERVEDDDSADRAPGRPLVLYRRLPSVFWELAASYLHEVWLKTTSESSETGDHVPDDLDRAPSEAVLPDGVSAARRRPLFGTLTDEQPRPRAQFKSARLRSTAHQRPSDVHTDWDSEVVVWDAARWECLHQAWYILRDRHDAEEAVQEAFIRAWRNRAACKTPHEPVPWLLQITRNEAQRLAVRRQRRWASEAPVPRFDTTSDATPETPLDEVLTSIATEQTLDALDGDERTLLRLRYVEKLTLGQMAAAMHVPEESLKVRLDRARARLRDTVENAATTASPMPSARSRAAGKAS